MLCNETLRFLSENNNENTIFIFTVCKNGLFINSRLKDVPRTLMYGDRTADVIYYADVTLFLHATSAGLCSIFCGYFLRFIALNAIWPHVLGAKLRFHPILYPLNSLNKTNWTRNG